MGFIHKVGRGALFIKDNVLSGIVRVEEYKYIKLEWDTNNGFKVTGVLTGGITGNGKIVAVPEGSSETFKCHIIIEGIVYYLSLYEEEGKYGKDNFFNIQLTGKQKSSFKNKPNIVPLTIFKNEPKYKDGV